MAITVLIAEDYAPLREIVRVLIHHQADYSVVAEVTNGNDALNEARAKKPDLIVIDVALPELSGIDATRRILDELPQTKVLALSNFSEPEYVDAMRRAGARGYVLKSEDMKTLLKALRDVAAGGTYFSEPLETSRPCPSGTNPNL
jgi:DNA-binding NarL/FixJ family response regulator